MILFFFSLVAQGVISLNDLPLAQSAVDKLANEELPLITREGLVRWRWNNRHDNDNNDKTA